MSESGKTATGEGSPGRGRSGCWEEMLCRGQCGWASGEEVSSRWVRRARGALQGMGEGPEAAGSLEEMWGMRRRRILMRSLLSREMWMVTLSPDGHLRI